MFAIRRPDTAFSLDRSGKDTKRIEDPAHLAFIRKLPSAVSGKQPCEACHIRAGSAIHRKKHTGGQQKPDDAWCLIVGSKWIDPKARFASATGARLDRIRIMAVAEGYVLARRTGCMPFVLPSHDFLKQFTPAGLTALEKASE